MRAVKYDCHEYMRWALDQQRSPKTKQQQSEFSIKLLLECIQVGASDKVYEVIFERLTVMDALKGAKAA
jgi:N-acyl-L-homoserine lactone synthetase